MLMTMRALTQAARTICYLDCAWRSIAPSVAATETARVKPRTRASLLTPVAKAFSSDIANEVASLGVQVHGGMGFIEETGAAQLFRDARIAPIYEGTNGIQAIDLGHAQTAACRRRGRRGVSLASCAASSTRSTPATIRRSAGRACGSKKRRKLDAGDALDARPIRKEPDAALAGATPYLRLFGLTTGGCLLAQQALAALRLNAEAAPRVALARFFAENIAVQAGALERTVVEGRARRDRRRCGRIAAIGSAFAKIADVHTADHSSSLS